MPALAALLACGGLAHAAAAQTALAQATAVSEVLVTATRVPQSLAVTPGAYVVDGADIQARQLTFAADALASVPGLTVTSSGQFSLASISIRGASADKTLVLIDGMPVNDPSQPAGNYDFAGLDLSDVDRIEVLTGPQGALWGSNAIGGVVSITTREPNGFSADLETGSLGETHVSASAGHSARDWALGFSVADFASTGVSASDVRNNYAPYGAPGLHNHEPDGIRDLTLGARGRLDPAPWLQLDAQARYNDARTAIDGYPPPDYLFSDTNDVARRRSLDGFLRARIALPLDLVSVVSASGYKIDRGDSGQSGNFSYHADREVYRWTLARGGAADPVSFEAGAEHEASRATLSTGASSDLGGTGLFGVGRWRPLQPLTLTGSVRWDDPDRYHAQITGRGSAALDVGHGFSLEASGGQGYKTPTISETVCDFCYRDPNAPPVRLRPEQALGYDAGLAWRSADGAVAVRATYFNLNVTDQISYVTTDFVHYQYVNIGHTRSDGIELEGEAALPAGFRLKASYTYVEAVDADTGARLLRIPRNTGSATLFWKQAGFDAALTVRAEDAQDDTDLGFGYAVRPGFVVADLAGGYAVNPHIRISARIENLAGAHYQQVYGYGEPGRTFYVGLHFRD
jgi:vitamin B12 transporter